MRSIDPKDRKAIGRSGRSPVWRDPTIHAYGRPILRTEDFPEVCSGELSATPRPELGYIGRVPALPSVPPEPGDGRAYEPVTVSWPAARPRVSEFWWIGGLGCWGMAAVCGMVWAMLPDMRRSTAPWIDTYASALVVGFFTLGVLALTVWACSRHPRR